jgi:hypothetical protein
VHAQHAARVVIYSTHATLRFLIHWAYWVQISGTYFSHPHVVRAFHGALGDNMPRDSASQFCTQPIIQLHVKTRETSNKRWGDPKAAQLAVGPVSESPKEE